jgi:serine/threonine protein kinase
VLLTKVFYRDLKLENILMRSETQPIIADFELSKEQALKGSSKSTLYVSHPGTLEYMAPELLGERPKEATTASDMWSVGVLLFKVRKLRFCSLCHSALIAVAKMFSLAGLLPADAVCAASRQGPRGSARARRQPAAAQSAA